MWLKNRRNKDELYNLDTTIAITVNNEELTLYYDGANAASIKYETEEAARQAYSYIEEGIKRGDKFVMV